MIGVGILGVGALGGFVAASLAEGRIEGAGLAAIAGRPGSETRLQQLAARWHCRSTTESDRLPALGARLVVETAGPEGARAHAIPLVGAGCDLLLMSTGVLADAGFAAELKATAAAAGRRIYLASGSIGGLDGLLSAREAGISRVRLTTRKHPRALDGAPHLRAAGIELAGITEPVTVFEGDAREAAAGFPSNLNVAMTLATALGDLERLRVRIIADPAATRTRHRVEIEAVSGEITVEMANRPSPANPRSSWIAALSALAMIRRIASPLWIG